MPSPPDPPPSPSRTPSATAPVAAATAACPEATGIYKFKPTASAETLETLKKFSKNPPEIGGTARAMAPALVGLRKAEVLAKMQREFTDRKCTRVEKRIGSPRGVRERQTMVKYEYPDGTLVRFKPHGDAFSGGKATYSVEVKNDPTRPDRAPGDVAFKVDENGKAVPKGPDDLKVEGATERARSAYTTRAMQAGHKSLNN